MITVATEFRSETLTSLHLSPPARRGRFACNAIRVRGYRSINQHRTRGDPSPRPLPASAFARRRASADKRAGRGRRSTVPTSIRPDHLEHGIGPNFKIVTPAPCAHDRAGEPGLVDAVPDHGLVDVDGDDFAER